MTEPRLRRYSKPRGAGDQTSGGRGKLLRATTALSRIEILVRETLQNSWDARSQEQHPTYGVRVYRMDESAREVLRRQIFTDLPVSLGDLAESLSLADVHAIEIVDRGTSGLDGPFRASEEAGDGEPNNFNSFVFDIGTTKVSDASGGTYGFGKIATFEVSRAHSVVYWSRCRGAQGELEHRMIAATLHEPYAENGARYTGAHWWGDSSDQDIVPLRGKAAEELGAALFRTHFSAEETGTSILIIDPVISVASDEDAEARERTPVRNDAHADLLVAQIANAMAYSAWPKVVPTDGAQAPMTLKLHKNRIAQDVTGETRRRYHRFVDALVQVRGRQGQQELSADRERPTNIIRESTYPIRLRPSRSMKAPREAFFGGRGDNIVGHLHLVESVEDPGAVGGTAPTNSLCLMRSNTELVVRYDEIVGNEDEVIQWHGVFKPTPECDGHFASSEPPTHDSWTPDSADSEVSTYVVAKTLQQIATKARAFLAEHRATQVEGRRSVRGVAMGLRTFVPYGDSAEYDKPRDARGTRRTAKSRVGAAARVEILDVRALPGGGGQQLTISPVSATSERVTATAIVYALVADGRLALDDVELTITWMADGQLVARGAVCELRAGEKVQVVLHTRVATALDVDLRAEAIA